MLQQVGCISPFPSSTVLSDPSFAYNHQGALLARNKAVHAPMKGPWGTFWSCPLLINMQINKRTAINNQISFKKQPQAQAFLNGILFDICLLFEWTL